MPILFTHGTADEVIPYEMSQKLYDQARGKKQLLLIPEGTHHNIVEKDQNLYIETVKTFLNHQDN